MAKLVKMKGGDTNEAIMGLLSLVVMGFMFYGIVTSLMASK